MPLPDSQKTIYKKNPLEHVICQVRFPSILRIDAHPPADFQDRIRQQYPILNERAELMTNPAAASIVNLFPPQVKDTLGTNRKIYDFVSADENWTITLTKESIALTANNYKRWQSFKSHFEPALQALIEIYRPAFFLRIGLRYQNVIQRSKLGLENAPWVSLLKPYIAGALSSDIADDVVSAFETFEIKIMDIGSARVQHGLVESEDNEECYLIDSDFFTDKRTEINNATKTLDQFNQQGTRLFQWCITEQLHDAMEPSRA